MKKVCSKCGKEKEMMSYESECYLCREKSWDESISNQIKSGEMTSTDMESSVYCPYCGEKIGTEDDDEMHTDGGGYERTCDGCEKTFKVDVYVSYHYSTYRT